MQTAVSSGFVLKLLTATCSVFRPGGRKFCAGEQKKCFKRANLLNSKIDTDNKIIISGKKKYYQWQKNIISGKKGECLDFIFPLLEFHEHT